MQNVGFFAEIWKDVMRDLNKYAMQINTTPAWNTIHSKTTELGCQNVPKLVIHGIRWVTSYRLQSTVKCEPGWTSRFNFAKLATIMWQFLASVNQVLLMQYVA